MRKETKLINLVGFILLLMGSSFYAGTMISSYGSSRLPSFSSSFQFNSQDKDQINTQKLFSVYDKLKNNYLLKNDLKSDTLTDGAIKGLVASLDDPYTVYFNKQEYTDFNKYLTGTFEGIGAEIGIRNNKLVVISPLKESPAEKAGLKPGDHIIKINESLSEGLSVEKAVTLIRGDKGSQVTLIIASGNDQTKEIKITRDVIKSPDVSSKVIDGVGYVEVVQFEEKTADHLKDELQKLVQTQKVDRVVLDFRNNPGGYLNAAVDMIGLFSQKGSVAVKEEDKNGTITELKTNNDPAFSNLKLAILINEGSASASEIVAGALRDLKGVQLIGQKSFGKGVVQSIQDLPDNSALKVTVAKWLTPKGSQIHKVGIEPDVKIEIKKEDIEAGRDPQLDKSIELIKNIK